MNRLSAGDKFPNIFLKDTEDKTVCIPEEVNTKHCVLLFFRGVRICMHPSVRIESGTVTGYLSKIEGNSEEFPHIWSS